MPFDRPPLLSAALCLCLLAAPLASAQQQEGASASAAPASERAESLEAPGEAELKPQLSAEPASPARASAILSLSVEPRGDAVEVSSEAFIAAPAEFAFSVFTDYESQPRFIPALVSVSISEREGNSMVVDQVGTARIGPFSKRARSIKRATLDPSALTARMQSTPESEVASHSALSFSPAPGGCLMRYELHAQTPSWVPQGIAISVAKKQGREQLLLLIKETERRLAAGSPR